MAFISSPFKKKKVETSIFGSQPTQPIGIGTTQTQTSYQPYNAPQPKPTMSQAASKYGSQYSSAFSPVTVTPSQPKPQAKPAPVSDPGSNYLSEMERVGKEQTDLVNKSAKDTEDYYNRIYNKRIANMQASIPGQQASYDRFKTDTEASVADEEANANIQKGNAENEWGASQRQAAMTRRESEARNRNRYAALNTSDSFGEGSYGRAQENVESDFNRFTQEGLRGREQKKFEIDQAFTSFSRDAKSLIFQEGQKLQDNLRKIQESIDLTDAERTQLVKEAYDQAKAGILEIKGKMSELKYNKQVSDDEYKKALALEQAKSGSQAGSNNNNKALTMVNNILNGNIEGISGAVRSGNIPILGTLRGTTTTQADYDGLKSLLSLAERGQLKGSGAVSDFEAKVLEKAAMAGLNQNLPTDEFKRRLELLQNDLMSGGAVDNVPRTIRVRDLRTGQTGTLPAEEFDPSLYQQI